MGALRDQKCHQIKQPDQITHIQCICILYIFACFKQAWRPQCQWCISFYNSPWNPYGPGPLVADMLLEISNKHVGRNTIGLAEKCCTILSFTDSGKRAKFGPRCWWGQKLAGQDISQISPASIDPSHPHYICTSFWYPWQWLLWYRP